MESRADIWQDGKLDRKDETVRGPGGPISNSCSVFSRKVAQSTEGRNHHRENNSPPSTFGMEESQKLPHLLWEDAVERIPNACLRRKCLGERCGVELESLHIKLSKQKNKMHNFPHFSAMTST